MSRAVMQQALEALENDAMQRTYAGGVRITNAAIALRAALAEPEQEPVAWRCENATPPGGYVIFQQYPQALADLGQQIQPLYTAPTPRKPEQQPVAWEVRCTAHPKWMRVDEQQFDEYVAYGWEGQKLYTAPTPRKPVELTDGEIKLLMDGRGEEGDDDYVPSAFDDFGISEDDLTRFARAVIAAYEKKQGEQT